MPTIHRLGPDDWQRLSVIRLRALNDSPESFWATADQEADLTPEQWRERLSNPGVVNIVAVDDGRDVGLAVGAPHHALPDAAGMYSVWVAPEGRGKGIGAAVISEVIGWAREAGYRSIYLDVSDVNVAAKRLYAQAGFTPTGRTDTFPPPNEHITEHELMLEL